MCHSALGAGYGHAHHVDVTSTSDTGSSSGAGDDRFAAFLESAPDAVVLVDEDGRIVRINPQFQRLFGYSQDELLGQVVEVLLPDSHRQRHVAARAHYAASPSPRPMGARLELQARRKDGTHFPVDISLSPLPGDGGWLVAAVVRDLTQRVDLEDERRRLHESRLRRRQTIEINDNVMQGLAAATFALELGDTRMAQAAVQQTVRAARRMMSSLLGTSSGMTLPPRPGDLRRTRRAHVLPALAHGAPVASEGDAGPEAAVRVVIADDVPEIRQLLRRVLTQSRGFRVVGEAVDGQTAVEMAATLQPDALLLDLAMPVMDGLSAIPEIRARSPRTKICVLSGYPSRDVAISATDLGAHAYLEKGDAARDLTRILRQLCLEPTG
jgi:PAS domain S-box-containing protein